MNRDIINSVKATLYDRVSSPVYGTFIFVWLLSNWKIVYVTFFADKKFLENSTRLDYIIEYFSLTTDIFGSFEVNSFFTHLFLFPIITTLIILLWLPKLLIKIDAVILKNKQSRRSLK